MLHFHNQYVRCYFCSRIGKCWRHDRRNIVFVITDADKKLPFANSSRDVWHNGDTVGKNRNYRRIVSIFFLLAHSCSSSILFVFFFFFVAKWFRERNSFFIVRRFNSTNSIFHRPRCRGFNWAQGVSIFVECNMQSSDLSNQILVCCRPHSDAATDSR